MSRLLPAVAIAALFAGSAAVAQTSNPNGTTSPAPSTPSVTAPAAPSTAPAEKRASPPGHMGSAAAENTMTDAQAKNWVDKPVYSSDDKSVGDVAAIERDASGKVTSMQADVGGFLGLGKTRVKIMPSQFKLSGDRVQLDLTADQVKQLPKVEQ
ncbi:MAG: PRC-barrel domain-containing protein [Hyphomicrobiaceae bacterium]